MGYDNMIVIICFIIFAAAIGLCLNPSLQINLSEMACDDGYNLITSVNKTNNTTLVFLTTPKYVTCLSQTMDSTLSIIAPNGTIMLHGDMYMFIGTIPPYYGEGTVHRYTHSNLTTRKPHKIKYQSLMTKMINRTK